MGLRQLCNQAADLSDGNRIVSQAVSPAVEATPQQSSEQLLRHQPAAGAAVGSVQREMLKRLDAQQHGQDEAQLKLLKQTGYWIKDQTLLLMHHSRVLESQGNKAQPIILTLSNPNYIRNSLGRSTGRAVFRAHLLAKQGRLVDVPQEMASNAITVEQLADYLEPILTYGRGHWQAGRQDMLLLHWGFKQSMHISELLNTGKMA
ncbi:hypothetical protein WJX79_000394 [Trebouxia sp. C0005]